MGDVIKFFVMFILLLFMLNPAVGMKMVPWTIGFQMLPLIVGLAVVTGLIVGAARLYISGKPLAIMGYQVLVPKIDQITQTAQRSVQEGPIQSGFAAQLAFPALCLLILFAVTGIRL